MIKVIFLSLRPDYHIINIDFDLVVNHIMEQSDHGAPISFPSVLQPERNYFVAEGAPLCDKGCLLHVFGSHFDLVVARETIHEGEDFVLHDVANQNINVGKREVILGAFPVQISVVYTICTLPSFLGTGTTLETHCG